MSFVLNKGVDAAKVFIDRKANVTSRWDPFYYRPALVALEKKVTKVTSQCLRDFAISAAGGSTPPTKQAEEHYDTTAEDGVPFIRVQNLSTTGELNLDDIKLITRSTHEGLLKRSRLEGGELLVKITGVGRMAVASVVPEGFEANINQHIVAIKTNSIETSKALASYLNLDLAEKLASKRSAGGTRPALDYPALLSMPIVFDSRIPKLFQKAVELHKQRLHQAKNLLASIDDMLLAELGIPYHPAPTNTLESRIFQRHFSELSGGRIDPIANQEKRRMLEEAIHHVSCPVVPLRKLIRISKELVKEIEQGNTYIGLENIAGDTGEYVPTSEKDSISTAGQFYQNHILFPKLRPYLNKTHLATFDGLCSTEFHVFEAVGVSPEYLTHFLRSRAIVGITSLLMTGNTLPRLQMEDILKLPIPHPSDDKQKKICEKIAVIRAQVRSLRAQAQGDLEQAKSEIEAMILGQTTAIS
jgi:restriction endonuclease S subunit